MRHRLTKPEKKTSDAGECVPSGFDSPLAKPGTPLYRALEDLQEACGYPGDVALACFAYEIRRGVSDFSRIDLLCECCWVVEDKVRRGKFQRQSRAQFGRYCKLQAKGVLTAHLRGLAKFEARTDPYTQATNTIDPEDRILSVDNKDFYESAAFFSWMREHASACYWKDAKELPVDRVAHMVGCGLGNVYRRIKMDRSKVRNAMIHLSKCASKEPCDECRRYGLEQPQVPTWKTHLKADLEALAPYVRATASEMG